MTKVTQKHLWQAVSMSAFCYLPGGNKKPPSEREGDRVSGGRSLRDFRFEFTSLYRALPQSPTAPAPSRREPQDAAVIGVWALPEARVACNAVIQRRNWR